MRGFSFVANACELNMMQCQLTFLEQIVVSCTNCPRIARNLN